MKKTFLFVSLLVLTALACNLTTLFTPDNLPATQPVNSVAPVTQTLEPATTTPEVFIPLTQAVPGKFQPTQPPAPTVAPRLTDLPAPTVRPNPTATRPPVNVGTIITYSPLTVIIPQAIASGASGMDFPRVDSDNAAWWEKTPGHLQVMLGDYYTLQGKTHQPAIYVYLASAYVDLLPAAFESIHRLQNYLYAPNNVPALDQLPGVPFFNAQILFAAQIQPLSFQNGKGIRYLTEYAQYPASANNTDLFYNFIGVTSDGERYIVAIFPLTTPVLAETSDAGAPLPARGIPYPYMANPNADMDAYYIAVTDLLNAQLPESFTPRLDELDRLIQSIWIEP
ncbi:MAG TPA: hypothetical protein VLH85_01520 [Levilinea sp.]|nr:hypothetical protein [Levilinea sp.]